MILSVRNFALTLGVLSISTLSIAQKKNETSAAVEFKNKFKPAFMSQDLATAKSSLGKAKEFIDLAAEHADTKESQKTLWLKGDIYAFIPIIQTMAEDTTLYGVSPDNAIDISIEAFKKGYSMGKKYQQDIRGSVDEKVMFFAPAANMAYEKEMFGEAAEAYELIVRYRKAVDVLDTTMLFNASLCYDSSTS